MNGFVVVIPARFSSTRLPGKPLADIGGRPMILHVRDRALASGAARVIIATDSAEVRQACEQAGADVVMTSSDHQSGTDRINEAVRALELDDGDIVVNVQGDEPLMPPANIRQVADLAAQAGVDIATLHAPLETLDDFLNPNVVKLVAAANGDALYFSRAPIPWPRDAERQGDEGNRQPAGFDGALRHLGIYAYRVEALRRFSAASPCAIELSEKLEQLRALWLGMRIRTAIATRAPGRGVDTPEDLDWVRKALEGGEFA